MRIDLASYALENMMLGTLDALSFAVEGDKNAKTSRRQTALSKAYLTLNVPYQILSGQHGDLSITFCS